MKSVQNPFNKMTLSLRLLAVASVMASALALLPVHALAAGADGSWEFSIGFSYNKSTYDPVSYSWNRRWGGSLGYYFMSHSEVEMSFQDSFTRTLISGYEDTQFHDRQYSLNWIQNFQDRNSFFQPYAKVGIGQLNRDADGTYAGGASPTSRVDSVTGVLGAGFRLYLLQNFAVRTEATSYLESGRLNTWNDNFAISIGVSYSF